MHKCNVQAHLYSKVAKHLLIFYLCSQSSGYGQSPKYRLFGARGRIIGKHSVEAQHGSSPQQVPLGTAGKVMHSHFGGGGGGVGDRGSHPLTFFIMIAICNKQYTYFILLCSLFFLKFILLNLHKYNQCFDETGSLHVPAETLALPRLVKRHTSDGFSSVPL